MKIVRAIAIGGVMLSQMLTVTDPVQAGLFDWLFGRRCCAPAVSAPVTAFSSGAACNSCSTGAPQAQVVQQLVVNYAPQTCFRTSWAKVPVTQYRPVTSVNPQTGCSTTCMRPCTTYSWQARRVPVTTLRPIYTVQTNPCFSPISNTVSNTGCSTCGSTTSLPGGGCSNCATPGAGTANPYYTPPVVPSVPGNTPTPAEPQSGGAANQQPELRKDANVPKTPTASNRPFLRPIPALSPQSTAQRGTAQVGASQVGASQIGAGTGATDPAPRPPGQDPAAKTKTSRPVYRLQPLPDPEPSQRRHVPAPRLLNPDDQTAQTSRPWRYATIRWNVQPASATAPVGRSQRDSRRAVHHQAEPAAPAVLHVPTPTATRITTPTATIRRASQPAANNQTRNRKREFDDAGWTSR